MNKRSLAILEKAFAAEVEEALEGGFGLLQTKSRLAEILAEDGYLTFSQKTIPGRIPVVVKGYVLTHLGRLTYCATCTEQSC